MRKFLAICRFLASRRFLVKRRFLGIHRSLASRRFLRKRKFLGMHRLGLEKCSWKGSQGLGSRTRIGASCRGGKSWILKRGRRLMLRAAHGTMRKVSWETREEFL